MELQGYTRSNWFTVRSAEDFKELVKDLGATDGYASVDERTLDGVTQFCLRTEGQFIYPADGEDDTETFYKKLQEMLPDGEAYVEFWVGHEGTIFVNGSAQVITNERIRSLDLFSKTCELAKEELGPEFQIQMD